MADTIFRCPTCKSPLYIDTHTAVCSKKHTFDRAKSGYLNLLMAQNDKNKQHGDDKEMAVARQHFLRQGYYKPLSDAICKLVCQYAVQNCNILDTGSGEGYYTENIYDALTKASITVNNICGIDISKVSVDLAAKSSKAVTYAVASTFNLPIKSKSADIVLEIFSPFCKEEVVRVLSKNGVFIMVYPLENHLWELKQAVYDSPYKNVVKPPEIPGFEVIYTESIKTTITLNSNADIKDLFMMTPYAHKTSPTDKARLSTLNKLQSTLEFGIVGFRLAEHS